MKTIIRFSLLCISMGIVSCDANKSKVTEVAKEFIQSVANNDKVAMYELYPEARSYTNLQPVKGISDADIKVEAEDDSTYIVNLDTKKKLVIKMSTEGTFVIADSYNVLQLDSVSYELAAKTGVPSNQLSDITNGQLFSDNSDYIDYLESLDPMAMSGNLLYHDVRYNWRGGQFPTVEFDTPVTNNGESTVKGVDYSVEFVFFLKSTNERVGTAVENGVDLAQGETHVFTIWKNELFYYANNRDLYLKVNFQFRNISKAGMLAKYGTFSGEEYQTYRKLADEKSSNNDSSDGYNQTLSDRKLTETDLDGVSKKDLEIMRNMIYAKYGYIFKRSDLSDYFSKYSWYEPINSDAAAINKMMSNIEKYNIEFIKKHE